MHVFVTGGSGHIGSAVVAELVEAGHQVLGLARSDGAAEAVAAAGAEVCRGDLDDLDGLRQAAVDADGVIHLAFKPLHSGDFLSSVAADLAAVKTIGAALEGSGKPFVSTSGTLTLAFSGVTGRPGTERDVVAAGPRIDAENAVAAMAEVGVRSSVVRLPPLVHSTLDQHGFTPTLIGIARATGVSGYPGDGTNRWPAVHTLDAARAYRLALELAPAGSRVHAVAEQGVSLRRIAEAIAGKLGVPSASVASADVAEHFAHLGPFIALDNLVSSELTRGQLGWSPTHPGLLEDLAGEHYYNR
jgi:nucleoside-diphosphate-sugar epimerase